MSPSQTWCQDLRAKKSWVCSTHCVLCSAHRDVTDGTRWCIMRDSVKGQRFVSLGNPDPHIDGVQGIETGKKIFRQTSLNAAYS